MSYFDILGIDETASVEDVKKAYKNLILKNHPDKGGKSEEFQKVKDAYESFKNNNGKHDIKMDFTTNIKPVLDAMLSFIKKLMDKSQRNINISVPVTIEDIWHGRVKKISLKVKRIKYTDDSISLSESLEDIYVYLSTYKSTYVFEGKGDDCIIKKFSSGDVIVSLDIQPHEYLTIDSIFCRFDLCMSYSISLVDYYLVKELSIPYIDNRTIVVPYDKNKVINVNQEGLPFDETRGNLIIYIDVILPPDIQTLQNELEIKSNILSCTKLLE